MLSGLILKDRQLFTFINSHHDSIVDFVMYWAADKWIWLPFYAWILYILIKIYGKQTLYIGTIIFLMILCTDQFSVLIKNNVMRLRPCHDPLLSSSIHLVYNSCGGQFGFISSHAANSMALGFFLYSIIPRGMKYFIAELIAYILLLGYSRVYLGAHFPADIVGGWILGIIVGLAGILIYKRLNLSSIRK
jgi:undecaprenyl-diphosphatase